MIDIRVVGPDEWKLWRKLRRAALAESPSAFGSTLADWSGSGATEDRWRPRLISVTLNVVLICNDKSAGMISAMAPGDDSAVVLISLWVTPFARGHGVADAAVRSGACWTGGARREQGRDTVFLSVKEHNEPAVRLYLRHGFADSGRSPDDPGERLMRLRL